MKFITVRELRLALGKVWQDLEREKEIVVTSSGKPVAILSDISGDRLEETLRALRRARTQTAVSRMRRSSLDAGRDRISEKEIEDEIRSVRRSLRR
ncbi:MAG: type II toxin-antitoxin system Phd/YefM family antitoxin [Acidobacteria bacterium]|nr:type II toxin-antitoxin system Phd/YefM family antitoxin [Acidobacteriota bacterium]